MSSLFWNRNILLFGFLFSVTAYPTDPGRNFTGDGNRQGYDSNFRKRCLALSNSNSQEAWPRARIPIFRNVLIVIPQHKLKKAILSRGCKQCVYRVILYYPHLPVTYQIGNHPQIHLGQMGKRPWLPIPEVTARFRLY